MRNLLARRAALVGGLASAIAVGFAGVAGATATYDITPVTTTITSELTSNVPVMLGIVGALLALGIVIRGVRKFVKL